MGTLREWTRGAGRGKCWNKDPEPTLESAAEITECGRRGKSPTSKIGSRKGRHEDGYCACHIFTLDA